MANLMERDIVILKILSLGVATLQMILCLLAAYGFTFSQQVVLRRLSIDSRAGYITRRRVAIRGRRGKCAVYALTRLAIEILTEIGLSCDEMRIGLPKLMFTNHEITVTKVLHTVHIESLKGFYKYNFVDSYLLKIERKQNSIKAIPDLQLTIKLKIRTVELNLEIDLGTVLTKKMVQRIAEQANNGKSVVVMCTSRTRLDNLHKACSAAYGYNKNNVLFVMLDTFLIGGFMNTGLLTLDNKLLWLNLDDA